MDRELGTTAPGSAGHQQLGADALEADKTYQDLLAVSRVSAAVSGLSDLDAILRVALDNVLSIMDGNVGGILLLDEETQILSYRVYRGMSDETVDKLRMQPGEGIAGKVAQSGKAILVEDISADPRVVHLDLLKQHGLKAFISVPLRSRERVLGVINVASTTQRRFSIHDMHLLHSIGDQVGVAVEQAKLHERLQKGRERYRQLARQVLMAQEEARRKLARELHDETSQSLSGLALNLQALVDMAEMAESGSEPGSSGPLWRREEFKTKLKKAHGLAIDISVEVGRLIRELRPTLLDTLGLVPAIKQYTESTLNALGIKVSFETSGSLGSLPPEVEAGLFRFAQGAIGNIARHADARNVDVSLECRANDLQIVITDDGKGFDVSKITGIEESGRGRGLFSMKERVALLGGHCSVMSQPGDGTTVRAKVPVLKDIVDDTGSL